MKYIYYILAFIILFSYDANCQKKIDYSLFFQQTNMYYSSDNITSDGFGFGLGCELRLTNRILTKVESNLMWGNGNAINTKISIGLDVTKYSDENYMIFVGDESIGYWAAEFFVSFALIIGDRTEILNEKGERPISPVPVFCIYCVPFKYMTESGFISVLEFGVGFGFDSGRLYEISLLSIGINL